MGQSSVRHCRGHIETSGVLRPGVLGRQGCGLRQLTKAELQQQVIDDMDAKRDDIEYRLFCGSPLGMILACEDPIYD